jgi:UDP-N-acetylglucosamine 2-epimerase (non-hydrolysing)
MRTGRPDSVLVQGDTLTAFAASLAATYEQCAVAHVEAGLRTLDPREPFPEEFHRRLIDTLAWVHYAPTTRARDNLLTEGCAAERVSVVGNTVVDAMRRMLGYDPERAPAPEAPPYRMVVTAHRRESFGNGIGNICEAVRRLVRERSDLEVVYVLHSNPEAHQPAHQLLGDLERVRLVRPLHYREFLSILASSHLVLTDSGGIQEEAPYLGKPVLVARTRTERPEALEHGNAELVGTDRLQIASAVCRLLDDRALYLRRAARVEPFGDGHASERIREDLRRRWMGTLSTGDGGDGSQPRRTADR